NVESTEGKHLFCGLTENFRGRKTECDALHAAIRASFEGSIYQVEEQPRRDGWMTTRLGGWLGYNYGPIHMLYESNSQYGARHLTLAEVQGIGEHLVDAIANFLSSNRGKGLLAQIDRLRASLAARAAAAGDLS